MPDQSLERLLAWVWALVLRIVLTLTNALRLTSSKELVLRARGTRVLVGATPIAEGGFSFVFSARDAVSGRQYALKKVCATYCCLKKSII
jgi:hypothetical protein